MRLRFIAATLAILLAVFVILCCATCGGGRGRNAPSLAKSEPEAGYDSQYRDQTRNSSSGAAGEMAPPMAGAAAPPAPGQALAMEYLSSDKLDLVNSQSIQGPAPAGSQGATSRIDNWFSPAAYAADNKPDEEYLIRTGTITLKIDNYDEAFKQVNATAAKYKGVLTDQNMEKSYDGTRSGYITLRLPKENFFAAWDELVKIGEVTNQNATAQDVGQEYISAMSRMKNLLAEQETLRGMLEEARQVQKTRGLGEAYSVLLQTEQRLSEVSGQLQGVSDQVAQMADRITRSTITVNLSERAVYQSETFSWRIDETFKAAWKDLILGVRNLLTGLIYFLVTCWLWLVPLAIVSWIGWSIFKRLRRSLKTRKSNGS